MPEPDPWFSSWFSQKRQRTRLNQTLTTIVEPIARAKAKIREREEIYTALLTLLVITPLVYSNNPNSKKTSLTRENELWWLSKTQIQISLSVTNKKEYWIIVSMDKLVDDWEWWHHIASNFKKLIRGEDSSSDFLMDGWHIQLMTTTT